MVAPADWKEIKVGDYAHITTGKKNTQDRMADGQYPFFVRSQNVERINSYSFDGEAVLTAGDGVGTGKVFHYINGKFDCHQRVYRITDFRSDLNGKFFYLMFSRFFYDRIMSMTAKSSVDSVRMEMISEMELVVPSSIREQELIAEALSDADAAIESLDALIAKKRDVKQATMQQLLTGRTRLSGFSETWKVEPLGGYVSILKGNGLSRSKLSESGKFPTLLYGELFTVYGRVIRTVKSRTDSNEGIASIFGDVLMPGSTTTTGEDLATASALLQNNVRIGGDVNIIRPDLIKIDPSWLAYRITNCHRRDVGSLTQGITIHHLYGREIASLLIPFPALDEQKAIVEILTKMDDELEALTEQVSKLRMVKEGMMQDLLTGKVRLV